MVTQEQFLHAAERAGIDCAHARALYGELYIPQPALQPHADPQERFELQNTLPRLVQTLLYLGVLLVIGSHAWWGTITERSSGMGGLLTLMLAYQAGFVVAAWFAARRGLPTLATGLAAIPVFFTPGSRRAAYPRPSAAE